MIPLRKKAETATTITLEWDPVPGAVGYRFQSNLSAPKWSHTFDPTRRSAKFSKAASYKVEALGVEDAGQYPAAAPPPPPPSPPSVIAGQGYNLTFADDFQTFDSSVWTDRTWYDPPPPANTVYVQNSVLHLVCRRSDGYPDITATTLSSRSFRRGYFEARMRWTKGNGAWPAFWLFSTKGAKGQASATSLVSELDVFEGQGSEPNVFYGTLHRNTPGGFGIPDQRNTNSWQPAGVDLTADFHVYSALWTQTEVIWYLDGRELMRWLVYDSTDQDMFILLYMWAGGWTRGTDSTTPAELHTEVDWVRVWQK